MSPIEVPLTDNPLAGSVGGAFAALVEPRPPEPHAHAYRMRGSSTAAADAMQKAAGGVAPTLLDAINCRRVLGSSGSSHFDIKV